MDKCTLLSRPGLGLGVESMPKKIVKALGASSQLDKSIVWITVWINTELR
jgi:hypothetical protein